MSKLYAISFRQFKACCQHRWQWPEKDFCDHPKIPITWETGKKCNKANCPIIKKLKPID